MYFIGLPPEVKAALDEMLAEFETEKKEWGRGWIREWELFVLCHLLMAFHLSACKRERSISKLRCS